MSVPAALNAPPIAPPAESDDTPDATEPIALPTLLIVFSALAISFCVRAASMLRSWFSYATLAERMPFDWLQPAAS